MEPAATVPPDAVPQGGARISWTELPESLRAAIEREIGHVTADRTHHGGFSPALAATLTTTSGPVFVKAVAHRVNPHSAAIYRREAAINRVLPSGLGPTMRWSGTVNADGDTWEVLTFDALPGHHVALPWSRPALAASHRLITAIGAAAAPPSLTTVLPDITSPDENGSFSTMWARLTETEADIDVSLIEPWCVENVAVLHDLAQDMPRAARGDRLVHSDLRADNIIVIGERAWAVDWPWAALGSVLCDALGMLPSALAADGVGGGDPARDAAGIARLDPAGFVTTLPGGRAPRADTLAILSAYAAFFTTEGAKPVIPEIPRLRAFQRAQGRAATAWLRTLLA